MVRSRRNAESLECVEVVAVLVAFLTTADLLIARNVCATWRALTAACLTRLAARLLSPLPALEENVELSFPARILGLAYNVVSEELYVCCTSSERELILFTHDAARSVRAIDEIAVDFRGLPCTCGFAGPYFTVQRRADSLFLALDCRTRRLLQPAADSAVAAHFGQVALFASAPCGTLIALWSGGGLLGVLAADGILSVRCEAELDDDLDALWLSTVAVVTLASQRHNTSVLRCFSFVPVAGGATETASGRSRLEQTAQWVPANVGPVSAGAMHGCLWYGVAGHKAGLTLLSWDTQSDRGVETFVTLPIDVMSCVQLSVCEPKQVVGALLVTPGRAHFVVLVACDGTAARIFGLQQPSTIAFHPRAPVAMVADEERPRGLSDSLIFEAFSSGIGTMLTFGDRIAPRDSAVVRRASALYWWGGVASYVAISVALLWTISALVYNGWLIHMQNLFGAAGAGTNS